ncbi:MAG: hypothetical protein SGPRY_010970 [Prymnesium sp.]
MLMGCGRAAYESIGVAVIAEFFHGEEVEVAMAARMIFNGLGGTAAFFLLPRISTRAVAGVLGTLAVLAGATFLLTPLLLAEREQEKPSVVVASTRGESSSEGARSSTREGAPECTLELSQKCASDKQVSIIPQWWKRSDSVDTDAEG